MDIDAPLVPRLPRFLYRYRPIDDFAQEIVSENKLFFSSVKRFNDPFDCRIKLEYTANNEQFREYIEYDGNQLGYTRTEQKRCISLYKRIGQADRAIMRRSLAEESVLNTVERSSICCFSEDGLNILMFGHYAKNHTGLCFEFDRAVLRNLGVVAPVTYTDVFPLRNFYELRKRQNDFLRVLFLTKFKGWQYENEWRAVRNKPEGHAVFDPVHLKSITFGCDTDHREIERVKRWKTRRPLYYWQAVKSETAFRLERKPV